ncbi:hypothetical protein NECAME_02635 [Necator americanus]|uniref:Uncharacterized protein n=1 Tax=Necator americanus TaxID=51031 RepID=W2TE89_NECAM|nr:hypothetical protein NECAME_02635 [Necator americanus]ETN79516.1 hypothetical protein NECAME_02635 [Necator americanus]
MYTETNLSSRGRTREMAISDLIQAIQDVAWPEFLQPHVEVLLLWITWAVDYIDLDYLESCGALKLVCGFFSLQHELC